MFSAACASGQWVLGLGPAELTQPCPQELATWRVRWMLSGPQGHVIASGSDVGLGHGPVQGSHELAYRQN